MAAAILRSEPGAGAQPAVKPPPARGTTARRSEVGTHLCDLVLVRHHAVSRAGQRPDLAVVDLPLLMDDIR